MTNIQIDFETTQVVKLSDNKEFEDQYYASIELEAQRIISEMLTINSYLLLPLSAAESRSKELVYNKTDDMRFIVDQNIALIQAQLKCCGKFSQAITHLKLQRNLARQRNSGHVKNYVLGLLDGAAKQIINEQR